MKKDICEVNGIEPSSARFLLNGERISDGDTPDSLGLITGDAIDLCIEMTGGGGPKRKNIAENEHRIMDFLEKCDYSDDDSEEPSEDDNDNIQTETRNVFEELNLSPDDSSLTQIYIFKIIIDFNMRAKEKNHEGKK